MGAAGGEDEDIVVGIVELAGRMSMFAIVVACLLMPAAPAMARDRGVIGDSLSVSFSPENPGWPALLWGDDVDNLSFGGAQMTQWAAADWWEQHVDPGSRWYILAGTNDAGHGTWPDYEQNLVNVVDRLLGLGVGGVEIIGTPRLVTFYYQTEQWKAEAEARNVIMENMRVIDLAVCNARPLVDCGPDLFAELTNKNMFQGDGTHLKPLGNETVAMLVPEPTSELMTLSALLVLVMMRTSASSRRGSRG
jgi:lysophospholipase L1-like esterase